MNIYLKNIIFNLLFLMPYSTVLGQCVGKLGYIKDKDGFTYLRKGPGTDYEIIDTVKLGVLFCCYCDTLGWYETDCHGDIFQRREWIAKTHVQLIKDLSDSEKCAFIIGAFQRHNKLEYKRLHPPSCNYTDSEFDKKIRKEMNLDGYTIDFTLPIFRDYYCKAKDSAMFAKYLDYVENDLNSADETHSFIMSDIFICNPDFFLRQIQKVKSSKDREQIKYDIDWGLLNKYMDEKSKELARYRKMIDAVK